MSTDGLSSTLGIYPKNFGPSNQSSGFPAWYWINTENSCSAVFFFFEWPQTPLCQVKQSMTRLTSLQFSFISITFQTCLREATPWSPWSDTGISQVPTINPFINHLSGYRLLTSAPLASYYCKLLDLFSVSVSEWDFIPKFWGLLYLEPLCSKWSCRKKMISIFRQYSVFD